MHTRLVKQSLIASLQIVSNSGRISQFSAVERSMLVLCMIVRSATVPLIFGIMLSTVLHPRSERLLFIFVVIAMVIRQTKSPRLMRQIEKSDELT